MGNEGKTWFQKFMESKYGWSKVICGINLKLKGGSICQLLRKRSLMTTDIFLFDVGKAKTEEGINYDVLESIKTWSSHGPSNLSWNIPRHIDHNSGKTNLMDHVRTMFWP